MNIRHKLEQTNFSLGRAPLGVTLLVAICLYGVINSGSAAERAMWVWSMGPKLIQEKSGSERSDFFSFVAAPHGNPEAKITTIFLFAKTNIRNEACMSDDESCNLLFAPRVREFLADAHSRGLEVHILDGDPLWALNGKDSEPADRLLSAVFNFNAQGAPEERFDGIQYDVEPYLLEEKHPYTWGRDTVTIWNQYLQKLKDWQAKVNGHNTATRRMLFALALPFPFGGSMRLNLQLWITKPYRTVSITSPLCPITPAWTTKENRSYWT